MFPSLSTITNKQVVSIDPQWKDREEELRDRASTGELVCPGCRQLLHFRKSVQSLRAKRRAHFAHRSKTECPLDHQSAEVMEGKALLYEWLSGKFPGCVELDVDVGIEGWDRRADVFVRKKAGRPLAYWVLDRALKNRLAFLRFMEEPQCPVSCQVVWTETALKLHETGALALTKSHRDLITSGEYDKPAGGGHLTFLDTASAMAKTFRNIHEVHSPNLFEARVRREGPLFDCKVAPKTGEILLQEEIDAYNAWLTEMKDQHAADAARSEAYQAAAARLKREVYASRADSNSGNSPSRNAVRGPFPCRDCGAITSYRDASYIGDGFCLCRACRSRRGL